MSIWSSIGKIVSGGVKAVTSLDPTGIASKVAGAALSPIDSAVQRQENKEDWKRQTSWQEQMTMQNQQYNSAEAEKARQFNASEAEKARQFNASEAEKAHLRNIDLFNMENAYNSPSVQLERMRQAGMNPALMHGGSLVPASASPSPAASGSAASGSAASGSAPSTPVLQNPLSAAQYRLLNEQATAQSLANREKANDLKSKEEKKDSVFDVFSVSYDAQGNPIYEMSVFPQTNYWQEQRQKTRIETLISRLDSEEKRITYDILKDTKEDIKRLKHEELNELLRKVSLLGKEEDIKDRERVLAQYGIYPDGEGWTNLFSILLTSPDNAANILNALYNTAKRSAELSADALKKLFGY